MNFGVSIIKNVIFLAGRMCSNVYTYEIAQKILQYKNRVYTCWLSSKFQYLGKNSMVYFPLLLHGGKYVTIGNKTEVKARGIISAWDVYKKQNFCPEINVGDEVSIGEDCHISAINKIEIGNNTLIGKKVTIVDNSHGETNYDSLIDHPLSRPLYSKGPVIIESNVWIGDKVTILPGVKIGKNSVVGANSVVTKDVKEFTIVGGNPAKVLKNCN